MIFKLYEHKGFISNMILKIKPNKKVLNVMNKNDLSFKIELSTFKQRAIFSKKIGFPNKEVFNT